MSIDLEHLATLHEAATPGEWYTDGSVIRPAPKHRIATADEMADAALIVAMRNALPELIEQAGWYKELAQDTASELANTVRDLNAAEARVAHLDGTDKDTE